MSYPHYLLSAQFLEPGSQIIRQLGPVFEPFRRSVSPKGTGDQRNDMVVRKKGFERLTVGLGRKAIGMSQMQERLIGSGIEIEYFQRMLGCILAATLLIDQDGFFAFEDDPFGDDDFLDVFSGRDLIHEFHHDFLEDGP